MSREQTRRKAITSTVKLIRACEESIAAASSPTNARAFHTRLRKARKLLATLEADNRPTSRASAR